MDNARTYKFEIYPSGDEWRWRLKAGNGENVANGGEGYSSKRACLDAVDRIKANAITAGVTCL